MKRIPRKFKATYAVVGTFGVKAPTEEKAQGAADTLARTLELHVRKVAGLKMHFHVRRLEVLKS